MSLWNWFKKKKRFDEEAIESPDYIIYEVFRDVVKARREQITDRDAKYLLLEEQRLKDLIWKYHNPQLSYHSNSEEFPDCDDFALMARGSIVYGASKEGMKYAPAFGGISYYSKRLDGWHRACWAITNKKKLIIFEPQKSGDSDSWFDPREEIKSFRSASI